MAMVGLLQRSSPDKAGGSIDESPGQFIGGPRQGALLKRKAGTAPGALKGCWRGARKHILLSSVFSFISPRREGYMPRINPKWIFPVVLLFVTPLGARERTGVLAPPAVKKAQDQILARLK